ncbi:MAG: hypothetical protein R2746_15380 [Acidimicrobiales bacterium]
MIVSVADGVAVALSVATWVAVSFSVGWWASRWPPERLHDGPVTRLRRWEDGGAWWQRHVRVQRWKDRLPEAGAFFGGTAKRHLPSRTDGGLEAFRRETIRAERVHWLILASTPAHLIWCRPTVFLGMVAYGVVFNVPFIVVQRANRGRLDRILSRRRRR